MELDLVGNTEIWADGVTGRLDVNQIGTVSVLHLPKGTSFSAKAKGRLGRRTIRFSRDGEPCESIATDDAPLPIELAGARVELTVDLVGATQPGFEQLATIG